MSWGTLWSLQDIATNAECVRDIEEVRGKGTEWAQCYLDELEQLKSKDIDWSKFKDTKCFECDAVGQIFVSPRQHEDCWSCEAPMTVYCNNCMSMYSDWESDVFLMTNGTMDNPNVKDLGLTLDDDTRIQVSVIEYNGEAKVKLSLSDTETVFDRECFNEIVTWMFPTLEWKLERLEKQIERRKASGTDG